MKTMKSEASIFQLARDDDDLSIEKLVTEENASIDERDDNGLTALHICATYGKTKACAKLLALGANLSLPDFESGWTPLHRAFYFGHLKISLLLINAGAAISDQTETANWKMDVLPKRERERTIRNHAQWKANIDHDGLSPLDLLSASLSRELQASKKELECTSVLSFGKADFTLGVPLPNSNVDVLRPRRVDALAGHSIVQLSASKHHSIALTREGEVYTWGHGRGGRLGLGDEVTQPEPQLIRSLSGIVVRMLCAAENHTLAVTHTGDLYAWGSNRFGQLGHGGSDAGKSSFSPKRVESLKKVTVVAVAAGDTHSVCFTDSGEIYSWGSNKHGQLGIPNSDLGPCLSGSGYGIATPKRVYVRGVRSSSTKNLQSSQRSQRSASGNIIVQVAASKFSTLVLCRAESRLEGSGRAAAPNEVYQWGHGSSIPSKVSFARRSDSIASYSGAGGAASAAGAGAGAGNASARKLSGSEERETLLNRFFGNRALALINIVQITAGLNHNAALSSEGHVYTWGLGSDQLGHGPEENRLSTPQLLETLLPENGGGRAVLVSAACNRTCVVSDVGDLYTWGATSAQGVLGHGAGSYQPIPKLVGGVKRAVSVAGGEDHTLVLTSAFVPNLPFANSASLHNEAKKDTTSSCHSLVVVAGADPKRHGRHHHHVRSNSTSSGSREATSSDDEEDDHGAQTVNRDDENNYDSDADSDDDNNRNDHPAEATGDTNDEVVPGCGSPAPAGVAKATSTSSETILTLAEMCERKIAESVDTRNCIAILARAEALHATTLSSFCAKFILSNLDAVLVQSRAADLETLVEDLNWSGPGTTALAGNRRASIDKSAAVDGKHIVTFAQGDGGSPSANYSGSNQSTEGSYRRPSSGSFSGGLFSPEGEAFFSTCRPRSGSKDLETAASVSKLIRSVKKKLQSIEELEAKMREKTIEHLNEEQQEKVSRKAALQSELKRLNIQYTRLEGEERIKEQAKLAREKQQHICEKVASETTDSAKKNKNEDTVALAGGASQKSETKQSAFAKATGTSSSVKGKQSGSGDSVNNSGSSPAAAPLFQSEKTTPQSQSKPATSAASPTAVTSNSGKQKTKKFISLEAFQQKTMLAPPQTGTAVPSFSDWMKSVDTTANNNTTDPGAIGRASGKSPATAWGGAGTSGKGGATPAATSLKDIVHEQSVFSSPVKSAAVSISSAAPNGRTVLSPPSGGPSTPATGAKSAALQAAVPVGASSNNNTSMWGVAAAPSKQPTAFTSTPTKVLSAPPPLFKSPSLLSQSTNSSVSVSASAGGAGAASTGGHSLVDFITPRKDKEGKAAALKGPNPNPVQSPAACPWASPTAGTAAGSSSLSSAPSPRIVDKPKSLAEIQSEEEAARLASNIQSLKGNENPWLIERRRRADSIEEVIRTQREEKLREEEEKKRLEAEREAAERAKREKKEREKEKQIKKQQRDKERKEKAAAIAAIAAVAAAGGGSSIAPEEQDKSHAGKSTPKKNKQGDGGGKNNKGDPAVSSSGGRGKGKKQEKSPKDNLPADGTIVAVEATNCDTDAGSNNVGHTPVESRQQNNKNSQPRKDRSRRRGSSDRAPNAAIDGDAVASPAEAR